MEGILNSSHMHFGLSRRKLDSNPKCEVCLCSPRCDTKLLRYHQVDTFGRSTIQHFDQNMSALKQLAARNYEDALQVSFTVST